jgi:CDP-4-dehydro-6-deoxyglucose reductase, E1
MKKMKYSLASSSWDNDEINAIHDVILSDNYSMGERVLDFEDKFSYFFGSKYAVMANSGSSANLLMIAALRFVSDNPLQPGDEVIVPAVSWATTYSPLYQYGYHIKFVDIDINTLNYDLESLEDAVSDSTRCIIAVNLLGNPNNFNAIKNIIGTRDILLLEDNCESMGAKYEGDYTGTFGLMGSFSTFFSHHISTMEGGVVITDNEELYHIMLSLRAHGWTRNLPKQNSITQSIDDEFYEQFRFVLPGYNLRPTEISAAIGIQQLKKLTNIVDKRIENSNQFLNIISKYPIIPQKEVGTSSWFGFSMIIKSDANIDRKDVLDAFKESGIVARPIVTGNFTRSESLKYYDYSVHGELKNADILHEQGLFIGNHHHKLTQEINHLDNVLQALFS